VNDRGLFQQKKGAGLARSKDVQVCICGQLFAQIVYIKPKKSDKKAK
jgi:hypothetical protein